MIEINQLSKQFGDVDVVTNLNLNLVPGEILAFLGPNGAGKSTTMKMLTGFLAPSEGSVKVFGHDVQKESLEAQKLIGYLPEGAPAYDEMTTMSYLEFIAEIRGYFGETKQQRVLDVISKLSLESVIHQSIDTLSKGFKRRVGLAQAIIHDPKVLILDEPTDGLDPNQKQEVRALIRSLSKDKIVIISTHILEEVSAVCNRVIIISGGKLLIDCSPNDLSKKSKFHQAVSLSYSGNIDLAIISEDLLAIDGVKAVEVVGDLLTVFPEGERPLSPILNQYFSQQSVIQPIGQYLEKGKLDDVFRQITIEGAA
ncbi:MAG: ABC-2 type transport system ATP-binding protein [Candidatus Azotimanducaceae bacterium]|jgi:ABC-2 type transport system ATP-binding protein